MPQQPPGPAGGRGRPGAAGPMSWCCLHAASACQCSEGFATRVMPKADYRAFSAGWCAAAAAASAWYLPLAVHSVTVSESPGPLKIELVSTTGRLSILASGTRHVRSTTNGGTVPAAAADLVPRVDPSKKQRVRIIHSLSSPGPMCFF